MPAQRPLYQGICQLLPRALVVSTLAYEGSWISPRATPGFWLRVIQQSKILFWSYRIQHQGQLTVDRIVRNFVKMGQV